MKKIIIGILLISLIFLTSCNYSMYNEEGVFPQKLVIDRFICSYHNEETIEMCFELAYYYVTINNLDNLTLTEFRNFLIEIEYENIIEW